ncbi:MAG: hypothetical protein ACI9C2_002515, partial [Gammaproteobacteria bacterium]
PGTESDAAPTPLAGLGALRSNQATVPAVDGVRRDDGWDLHQEVTIAVERLLR